MGRDTVIYGVQTRGSSSSENRWVTSYILAFREDKAKDMIYYQEPFGSTRVRDSQNFYFSESHFVGICTLVDSQYVQKLYIYIRNDMK